MDESRRTPVRKNQMHGLTGMLKSRGRYKAQLDGRSSEMQALTAYKANLLSSLGGAENLSAQELTLVDLCGRDWLILQRVDAFILQAGLFNKKKRAAWPLTTQRMQIADSLTRKLQALGLQRRAKQVDEMDGLLQATPSRPEQ